MITIVLKRNADPDTIQLTQKAIMKELWDIKGSEMLLANTWTEGIKNVRTPYFSLMEADCTLSGSYLSSNLGLIQKDNHNIDKGTGGYLKRAMLASCIGYESFANRIYNYEMVRKQDINVNEVVGKSWHIHPNRRKLSTKPYHVQVGFVPGAIIRYSAVKDIIDSFNWDEPNLVKMSTELSFHLWNTNRRVQVNPNTTYVSSENYLENPSPFNYTRPDKAVNVFQQEGI